MANIQADTIANAAGTGTPGIKGEPSTGSATAGDRGEYLSANGTSSTVNAAVNLTSLALTAGDWDVDGVVVASTAGGASDSVDAVLITSSTPSTTGTNALDKFQQHVGTTGRGNGTIRMRISLASTTTYYLHASTTSASTTTSGRIHARRAR